MSGFIRGLTSARRRVLEWFADHPHSNIREAAAGLGLSIGAPAQSLALLRREGFVVTETAGLARMVVLSARGWAALGREPRCPTCGHHIEFRNADAGVTEGTTSNRHDDRAEESDARGRSSVAALDAGSQMGAVGLSTAGSACPSTLVFSKGDAS